MSSLKITFCNQPVVDFKRLDSMRPMDLGDGPELLELNLTIPEHASDTLWNPLFGEYSLYTGDLSDGRTSRPVFVKWARSKKRMAELKKEGDFYCSALRKLQGVVVPNFYGYYAAKRYDMRGLGCMILEKMDGGWENDNRSKLEAVYRLHQLGIRHGGLGREKNFVTHEDKVYIIDFSKAKARCGCELTRDRIRLCTELVQMERQLGDGKTNRVLEEIGVPPWILMAYEVKPDETAAPRCAL